MKETLQGDLMVAMRARDQVRMRVLRAMIALIHSAEARDATPDHPVARDLTDDEVFDLVASEAAARRRAIAAYDDRGRHERAAEERAELAVLTAYLTEG